MYSYGSPHMAAQKQDDQHQHTFSSYVRIQNVVLKTYLGRWTIGRSGERGSGISVLPARYDDDDDIYSRERKIGKRAEKCSAKIIMCMKKKKQPARSNPWLKSKENNNELNLFEFWFGLVGYFVLMAYKPTRIIESQIHHCRKTEVPFNP